MMWSKVQSEEELRTLGKLKEVAEKISLDLDGEKVPNTSWKKLYDFVENYQITQLQIKKAKWARIDSEESLKALGSFKEVKSQVLEDFREPETFIKGWQQLYQFLHSVNK